MFTALVGAIAQGILWGAMVLGVYITYKLLDIADLTADGSFAFGGCVCAVMIVNFKMNPLLALVFATFAGMLAGFVTGALHTIFEIPAILAGILTQISLWSINLRVMGKSNIPLLKTDTIFSWLTDAAGVGNAVSGVIIGGIIIVFIIIILYWFFGTELGSSLRATGNNEAMIRALGVNTGHAKLLALIISNGLIGLSGGLIVQSQKYADINAGTGAIVIGLAAIVIGEVVIGKVISFWMKLLAAVVGSIVYFVIRSIVLQLGMDANDMKMLSAIIVALALAVPVMSAKIKANRAYSPKGE
ncbi:ABC transporter permease [Lachnoanaerobaculum sp. Marseille-Q4761]|jgi:inner-membrane translocator|uniref:ABC transporter permease n=1 Tax=Lachnoanaerobaculum sp. Marseille-Q4761 TaxID=2819511 RepID=UPI001AA14E97|nr:ABC transporter permease [Lachnoanaerobaculum sp. Marseille-Q4761]MBO1871127.1 ABC transporter permease [Lachnoanaerobaculum sp. Marseille-Q4761]